MHICEWDIAPILFCCESLFNPPFSYFVSCEGTKQNIYSPLGKIMLFLYFPPVVLPQLLLMS